MNEILCPPLKDWIAEESEEAKKECRWCSLAVLIGEYQKALENNNHKELSTQLGDIPEKEGDIFLMIAEKMDEIKELVNPELKDKLHSLDCEAQLEAREEAHK